MIFRGSGSILLGNPIFLWFFRGGGGGGGVRTLCPPSGSAHRMHLKEGTCLKCSFQRVVIIGRKVGLDYNSWYACLPLIRHVGRSSGFKLFANFLIEVVKGERERERMHDVCTRIFCPQCFGYNYFRWGPKTQTYRAHRLLYGKVGHSTVLTIRRFADFLSHAHIFNYPE